MNIDINIKEIIQKIDIKKLVEEKISLEIENAIDIEDMVNEILEEEEAKNILSRKIVKIIDDYLNSEDGKDQIIDAFNCSIKDSDILNDDRILDLIIELLKKNLKM